MTIALTLERHDGRHGRSGEPDLYAPRTGTTAQTVTVTGVDDALVDGPITLHDRDGGDERRSGYQGIDVADVTVSNTDNDAAGVTVTPTTGLTTTEAGGTATFTVVLNTQPTRGRDDRADARATRRKARSARRA